MVDVLSLRALQVPPRPPTPPRSSSLPSAPRKSDPNGASVLNQPGQLPSPPDLSPHPSSDPQSKKVNFSPLTSYIKPLDLSHPGARPHSSLRNPPSSQSKPAKSILKSRATPPGSAEASDVPSSSPRAEELPTMLESITQQLAGESRVSRADAYMQLLGSLTAYRNLPDTALLCEKAGSIAQYIRRDISQDLDMSNISDLSLVRQALNLLSMFMWKPEVSAQLPEEFKVFFLDHSIAALQDSSLPKTLVVDYLRILSLQNFSPKILVNSKVHQLLSALKDITERSSGKAVTALRLAIYEKLLHQARTVFISQAGVWVDNLVTALLHNVRDIRVKAIKFGFQVAVTIGPSTTVSEAVQDAMDVPGDDGSMFVDEVSTRLTNMISRDCGAHVPQVWCVVILLLRRSRWSIEQWGHLKKWLLIIQKCFNHSDSATKLQALVAWDRFVYTVQPTEKSSNEMTKLLSRPILSQLERKRSGKPNALTTQAFSSYYHLLYYAFRPSTSHDRLEYLWKEYIFRPYSRALVTTTAGHETACRILATMFWNPHPKPWDDKKPLESNKLAPTDLPRLDFQWTRSRLSTILPVFELLFKTTAWPDGNIHDCPVGVAWSHLSKSLAEASSKEIQPSSETMHAVGSVLGVLQRVWKGAPGSLNVTNDKDLFLGRFHFLLTTIIPAIGTVPFTDRLLLKTSDDTFQTTSTPSHRHGQCSEGIRAPSVHLLQLILQTQNFEPNPAFRHLVRGTIEACLNERNSRSARLDVLCHFADSLDAEAGPHSDANTGRRQCTWEVVSDVTTRCLDTRSHLPSPIHGTPSAASRDYGKVKRILLIGTRYPDLASVWTKLLESLATTIQADRADNALAPIIEDLAHHISFHAPAVSIPLAVSLLHHAVFRHESIKPSPLPTRTIPNPKQRQETDVPFGNMMMLVNDSLRDAYSQLPSVSGSDLQCLLEGTTHFADQCPFEFRPALLAKLQFGLSIWITDSEKILTRENVEDDKILASIQSITSKTVHLLETCETTDSSLLKRVATFVTSGLVSSHRSVVNRFIRVWNDTFGLEDNLSYPTQLEEALRKLRPYTELLLPCFPEGDESEVNSTPPEFIASQEDALGSDMPRSAPVPYDKSNRKSPVTSSLPSTPVRKITPTRHAISTPNARIRHDNSQIHFVAVESSPTSPLETQAFTERQRDVRERQRTEASRLFSSVHAGAVSRQHPTSPRAASPVLCDQAIETPPLPAAASANDDEVPLSSPTPGSKDQNPQLAQLAVETSLSSLLELNSDPPSSPPQQSTSHAAVLGKSAGNEARSTGVETSHADNSQADDNSQPQTPPSGSKRKRASYAADEQHYLSSGHKKRRRATRSARKTETVLPSGKPSSTGERDSPNSPGYERSNVQKDQERVDMIPDSFSDELEQQIASQLEQDMELSLDVEPMDNDETVPARSTRFQKRKWEGNNATAAAPPRCPGKQEPRDSNIKSLANIQPPSDQARNADRKPDNPHNADSSEKQSKSRRRKRSLTQKGQQQPSNVSQTSSHVGAETETAPPAAVRRRSSRIRGHSAADEANDHLPTAPEDPQNGADDSGAAVEAQAEVSIANEPSEHALAGNPEDSTPVTAAVVQGPEVETAPEEPAPSPTFILSSLKNIRNSIQSVSFGKPTLREIDDLMFDIKVEAHEAVRRHGS